MTGDSGNVTDVPVNVTAGIPTNVTDAFGHAGRHGGIRRRYGVAHIRNLRVG